MRVLIIEDNESLALEIQLGLKKSGFVCEVALSGEEGEELAYSEEYDAIILDLNLPDKDGIEILRFLREENMDTPILITTARDTVQERTLGLDVGADDYITKPFEIDELRARLQAVIRRSQGRNKADIAIGRMIYNVAKREVRIDHKIVELQAREVDILEYIISQAPGYVTVEQIADHVYGESYTNNSSVLRVHLAKIRKKLKDTAGEDVIFNQRGRGYYLWNQ